MIGSQMKTVVAQGIYSPTTIEGFIIQGERNFNLGGNSYGVYVVDSTSALTITGNQILAGDGGPGVKGMLAQRETPE